MRMKHLAAISLAFLCVGCAPEVGSERWCKKMDDKPAGDWTVTEAKDYAKHCLLDRDDE